MTDEIVSKISDLRLQGRGVTEIAEMLNLPVNTVKSHLRRHPETGNDHLCPQCGRVIRQHKGRKEKKFCSDKCRNGWWNAHQSEINKKAYYTLVCHQCGKEFVSYGNQKRKFCCRECYGKYRQKISGTVF